MMPKSRGKSLSFSFCRCVCARGRRYSGAEVQCCWEGVVSMVQVRVSYKEDSRGKVEEHQSRESLTGKKSYARGFLEDFSSQCWFDLDLVDVLVIAVAVDLIILSVDSILLYVLWVDVLMAMTVTMANMTIMAVFMFDVHAVTTSSEAVSMVVAIVIVILKFIGGCLGWLFRLKNVICLFIIKVDVDARKLPFFCGVFALETRPALVLFSVDLLGVLFTSWESSELWSLAKAAPFDLRGVLTLEGVAP